MASSRTVIKREDTVFESIETQSELLHYLINCFKQGKISEIEIPIENSISNDKGVELFPKGTLIKINFTRGRDKDNFYLNGEFVFHEVDDFVEDGGGGNEPSAESTGKFKRKDDMIINWHLSIHDRDPEEQERISKKIQKGQILTAKEKSYWNIKNKVRSNTLNDFNSSKACLKSLIQNSVEKRLISDVPIGTF